MASWERITLGELRKRPRPLIEFYDDLTEQCGRLSGKFDIEDFAPIDLARRDHVRLFRRSDKEDDLRVEVDEKMIATLCELCKSKLVFERGERRISEIVGAKIAFIGRDPEGKYKRCNGWYARKIDGRTRARALLRLPLSPTAVQQDERLQSVRKNREDEQKAQNRRARILRGLGRIG